MPKRRYLELDSQQRNELAKMRDYGKKPYLRERASALLKIADGLSAHQISQTGLLKKRDPDSLYHWLDRYEAEGLQGLFIKKGRGRKPSFSP